MPSKSKRQKKHFKFRCLQRHGLVITNQQYTKLIENIQIGNAEFIEKQSNRVSVFRVKIDEKNFRVIYDKQRKTLVSALPE